MPKINVYVPDELATAVKEAGVPISAVCQRALEQAVRRVTAIREIIAAPYELADPPALNFTRRAMTVLEAGQEAAHAAGRAGVETDDVLAALVAMDNMAVRVLSALEITPAQVTNELSRRADGQRSAGASQSRKTRRSDPASPPGLGPEMASAVELAVNESSGLGNSYVGCEHLLLGLIAEPNGAAGSVLRSLGADLRVTRRTVAAALAGWGAAVAARDQPPVGTAQPMSPTPAATRSATAPDQLAAAIRGELAPVVARIERLEALVR